jgi:hypothetical protein
MINVFVSWYLSGRLGHGSDFRTAACAADSGKE